VYRRWLLAKRRPVTEQERAEDELVVEALKAVGVDKN
jgi:hypothetical protein